MRKVDKGDEAKETKRKRWRSDEGEMGMYLNHTLP